MTMVGVIAGCKAQQAPQTAPSETPSEAPTVAANGNDIIECAIHGGQWFLRECEVEKTRDDTGALVLVVHHLDGGFRRFKVVTDGRGLETADGFEQAQTSVVDDRLDVRVGDDRYRFPATIRHSDKPA
ncbi:MAG: hypothetical protein P0Y56_00935 [Candidatus Andeanibacterium colombiense]|uniref:Uncharacterized protein n=1 Tax=Candidatus Andeanibacterium colombiense TaxID=3121345 RepID=A0AAJ6BNA0_9SPHN|nr:MAG: hypothetical protein P0Y56_00935 [Sphingomonadaceae bacterium]